MQPFKRTLLQLLESPWIPKGDPSGKSLGLFAPHLFLSWERIEGTFLEKPFWERIGPPLFSLYFPTGSLEKGFRKSIGTLRIVEHRERPFKKDRNPFKLALKIGIPFKKAFQKG